MTEIVLVCIGGAAGSLLRWRLGSVIAKRCGSGFPFGTLAINLSGALLLGVISALDVSRSAWLLIAEGTLGAYTTFSTFMYEGFTLFRENKNLNALCYIAITLILGIAGFFTGFAIMQAMN